MEVFRQNFLEKKLGYNINFCQDNLVKSKINVLRGLHFQCEPFSQAKLVYVSSGAILDVVVDIRKNSKTYAKYYSTILSSDNKKSIFIPKGFAHGYLTINDNTIVNYKVDNYYNKLYECGICYNDKKLNIDWSIDINNITISEKDKNLKNFNWI